MKASIVVPQLVAALLAVYLTPACSSGPAFHAPTLTPCGSRAFGTCERHDASWRRLMAPKDVAPTAKRRMTQDEAWNSRFKELLDYRAEHGDCNVPHGQGRLGYWVSWQRQRRNKGKLSRERIVRLDDVGFDWDPLEGEWLARFDELVRYMASHGDCNVMTKSPLGKWVSWQRLSYSKGKISEDHIRILESIGFTWNVFDEEWESRFDELNKYKEEHGNCDVQTSADRLGSWVSTQRQLYKEGVLSNERIERLENIGFAWDPFEARWYARFDELVMYREEHGNCNVNTNTGDPLGYWVSAQRKAYKKGSLSKDRVQLLESVGFQWELSKQRNHVSWRLEERWKTRYAELVRYLTEHGECNVPQRGCSLGSWVVTQRGTRRKGNMPQYRIDYLDCIGFEWEIGRGSRRPAKHGPDVDSIARIIEVERPSPEMISSISATSTEGLKTRVEVGEAVADALQGYLDKIDGHGSSQHKLKVTST